MDRDRRWDRVKRAYDAIVHGEGTRAGDAVEAVTASYARDVSDEFVEPVVIGDPAAGRIRGGDTAIFFNFRPDRARELSWALTQAGFDGFDRGPDPPLPRYVQMTEYADDIDAPVAFPGEDLADVMAQALARHGVEQLHVAETEKYAHVTYFFNGGAETRCDGEDWELVDSPRDVATYDQKPGMSADGVADAVVDGLGSGRYGFCLVNFANPDMVGHSGSIPATVEAVETVDRCLARVVDAVEERGGVCLVTADHGNAETMLNADGSPHTAHTTNPVPLIVTDHGVHLREGGRLADIAPTALHLLGVQAPEAMSGRSLV
jgi:2,3-bisphosphoglycerate-independent phosphoglycerate mutase